MANTSFNGPVRSEKGFQQINKAASTGVITSRFLGMKPDLTSLTATVVATAATLTYTANVITVNNYTGGAAQAVTLPAATVGTIVVHLQSKDVANALLFLLQYNISSLKPDETGAKCQKFNIVGKNEINNLELAQFIAKVQNKDLIHEMVDFHSSRPGHDLRYALDGSKMKNMGWTPQSAFERLESVIKWTLDNDRWLIT